MGKLSDELEGVHAMWNYWRDKYGHIEAIEQHYPELLATNPDLQQAVTMIQNGERLIDSIMQEYIDKAGE